MNEPKTQADSFLKTLQSATLPLRQEQLDREISDAVRQAGCPCGGRLHVANFPRKCLAVLAGLAQLLLLRLSFCCGQCRRRRTPPSVRFLGRRQYGAVLVLLLSAAKGGALERHVRQASQLLGIPVSPSTLERWASWWRQELPGTGFWQSARARFLPPLDTGSLAAGLLRRFRALASEDGMLALLEFLSPLTTASCDRSGRGFSMGS